jgi:hypothetical protein
MPTLVRSLTLAAALLLAVVPSLSAENTGTDPKPRNEVTQPSILELLQQYDFLSFFAL